VSVIVVSFNRAEDLGKALQALFDTGYPELQVIVVDNASQDAAADVAAAFPGVTLLRNAENRGFAEANNQGLALATGDYIALINNDAVVEQTYFHDLVAFLEAHPRAAAAGGKAYLWNDENPLGDPRNHYFSYAEMDPRTGHGRTCMDTPDEVREVATLSGCAVLIRRAAIEDVGQPFLEPLFFTYYEETDFFARCLRRGWTLHYTGRPAVWHQVRASSTAVPYHYFFHMARNRLLFAWRNFDEADLAEVARRFRRRILRRRWLHPLQWRRPTNEERRGEQDAMRWFLGHAGTLAAQRQALNHLPYTYRERVSGLPSTRG
jgi:GT2 family glycosyltransferase